jgi:hypothetical protein
VWTTEDQCQLVTFVDLDIVDLRNAAPSHDWRAKHRHRTLQQLVWNDGPIRYDSIARWLKLNHQRPSARLRRPDRSASIGKRPPIGHDRLLKDDLPALIEESYCYVVSFPLFHTFSSCKTDA